jgi:hypothetical protein
MYFLEMRGMENFKILAPKWIRTKLKMKIPMGILFRT